MPAPDEISLFAEKFNELGCDYMVTGATAAIIYGQPRVTNDIDVVIAVDQSAISRFAQVFSESEFYLPPASVIAVEQARTQRGHFNVIHHDSGYKADIYLAARDPLHLWALPQRRTIAWATAPLSVAPPEYVILRKMEYFREGGSSKHISDISAILASTPVDHAAIEIKVADLGLGEIWNQFDK
jgi:hypothetical protein